MAPPPAWEYDGRGGWRWRPFGFADLDYQSWLDLDVGAFLAARVEEFLPPIARTHAQFERAELANIFFTYALPRVRRTHQRYHDIARGRRDSVIGGALSRIVRQLVYGDQEIEAAAYQREHECYTAECDGDLTEEWLFCADQRSDPEVLLSELEDGASELSELTRLESVRHQLTTRQYKVLYRVVVRQEGPVAIGRQLAVSYQAVGRIRQQARSRLIHLAEQQS